MPTYEYACEACGHELEVRQSFDDDPLTVCPSCGADTLERLVSRSSFALKGSGWYSDGYGAKKDEKKSAASSEPKAEPKAESKAEPKAESKAENKAGASSETPAAPKAEAPK